MNFEYKRTANYYETDRMGIVHHSNHIRYFEEARIAFLNSINCDVMQLENEGVIIPNVDAYAKYLSPVRFDETITVEVTFAKFNGAVMRFEYVVKSADKGIVKATGYTTHCFVNSDFKPISIKRKFPNYYKKLAEQIKNPEP